MTCQPGVIIMDGPPRQPGLGEKQRVYRRAGVKAWAGLQSLGAGRGPAPQSVELGQVSHCHPQFLLSQPGPEPELSFVPCLA